MPWEWLSKLIPGLDIARRQEVMWKQMNDLKDEYRDRAEKQEQEVRELRLQLTDAMIKVTQMENNEKECHKLLIQTLQQNRDLKEENIFLKRKNSKDE